MNLKQYAKQMSNKASSMESFMHFISSVGKIAEAFHQKKLAKIKEYKKEDRKTIFRNQEVCDWVWNRDIKESVEDCVAEPIIQLLAFCGSMDIDIDKFMKIKINRKISK